MSTDWQPVSGWVVQLRGATAWITMLYTASRNRRDSMYAYGPEEYRAMKRRGDARCVKCLLGPRGD